MVKKYYNVYNKMSELKKCKLCKEAGELSSEDIPKWSKRKW